MRGRRRGGVDLHRRFCPDWAAVCGSSGGGGGLGVRLGIRHGGIGDKEVTALL